MTATTTAFVGGYVDKLKQEEIRLLVPDQRDADRRARIGFAGPIVYCAVQARRFER
jgi:hypothetical protein